MFERFSGQDFSPRSRALPWNEKNQVGCIWTFYDKPLAASPPRQTSCLGHPRLLSSFLKWPTSVYLPTPERFERVPIINRQATAGKVKARQIPLSFDNKNPITNRTLFQSKSSLLATQRQSSVASNRQAKGAGGLRVHCSDLFDNHLFSNHKIISK